MQNASGMIPVKYENNWLKNEGVVAFFFLKCVFQKKPSDDHNHRLLMQPVVNKR